MDDVLMVCTRCGAETEWDDGLGGEVLCVVCWDQEVEVLTVAEGKGLWREANEEKVRGYWREYEERHRGERREWRERNRERLNKYRCDYYAGNYEFREHCKEYQRSYYGRNRDRVLSRRRERYVKSGR